MADHRHGYSRSSFDLSIGFGFSSRSYDCYPRYYRPYCYRPPVVVYRDYCPPPVIVETQPVYVAPPPVVYQAPPPVVYQAPPPVAYQPAPVTSYSTTTYYYGR
jgi:hypothetical protein